MSKKFKIDSRLILQLGQDSIKDHTTALVELVKNSFDADASKAEVEIYSKGDNKLIRVADNGTGMSLDDIENSWLRIGYSEKTNSKISPNGRRKTGEKGIGRIASDRLGSKLKMKTKAKNDEARGLIINWDDFYVAGTNIEDVKIKEIKNPTLTIPQKNDELISDTGTELVITELRGNWEKEDIENLYLELSYFSPTFTKEFEIEIINDIDPTFSKVVTPAVFDAAEIELRLVYDGDQECVYEFKNKKLPSLNKTEIMQLNQLTTKDDNSSLKCGQIELQLFFFVRTNEALSGTELSLPELKTFLNDNYGVKLYRDNVVVKPYGFANNQFGQDWLGLDIEKAKNPAGVGRKSYKVNANNIVGSVNFKRDENVELKDSAGREGLLENKAFRDLKGLINSSIRLLGGYRHDITKELAKGKKLTKKIKSTNQYLSEMRSSFGMIISDIGEIKDTISKGRAFVKEAPLLEKSIKDISNAVSETESTLKNLLNEKRVLSGLATLGISSAVFGHETQGAISQFKKNAKNAKAHLISSEPNIEIAVSQLKEALNYAKLVSSWGDFALSRIEKGKRIKTNKRITPVIKKVIEQLTPALEAREITIEKKLDNLIAKTYIMDVETIFINLLTNAYNAVPNSINERVIRIELKHEYKEERKGFMISVADSGPGVAKEYQDKIWEPLFTTRVGKKGTGSGTGLGLTIVKSIVNELEGEITLEVDDKLKGAKFVVWLPRE